MRRRQTKVSQIFAVSNKNHLRQIKAYPNEINPKIKFNSAVNLIKLSSYLESFFVFGRKKNNIKSYDDVKDVQIKANDVLILSKGLTYNYMNLSKCLFKIMRWF